MPGIALPRRELWLPQPLRFAKQFFKSPGGAIYRNAGGNVIYDESSEIEDCCCDEPECDGTAAVRMDIDVDGWVDDTCNGTLIQFGCPPTSALRCESHADSLNGHYSTTDLRNTNSEDGNPRTDTFVRGVVHLGTFVDPEDEDPELGDLGILAYERTLYQCVGGDWEIQFIDRAYAVQLHAGMWCFQSGEDHFITVDNSGDTSHFIRFVAQVLRFDASGNYVEFKDNVFMGMLRDSNIDSPGHTVPLTVPFSKATFTAAQAGTVIPDSPLDLGWCNDLCALDWLIDAEVTMQLFRS